jgi:hypothetical protein
MAAGKSSRYDALTALSHTQYEAALKGREPPEAKLTPEQKAESLRQRGAAGYVYATGDGVVSLTFDERTWKPYMDRFLKEAGDPADPVERMLQEQLAMANHAVVRLCVAAVGCQRLAEATAYMAGVPRLLAEFRRTALALESYRTSARQGTAAGPAAAEVPEPSGETASPVTAPGRNGAVGHGNGAPTPRKRRRHASSPRPNPRKVGLGPAGLWG